MFARNRRDAPGIDITSMIDVVFIILIFFIVTTQFAQQSAVEIQLPRTEGETREADPKELQLSIDAEDRIWLDGAEIPVADLGARLAPLASRTPEAPRVLQLKADGRASWEVMAAVFDACRRSGITTAVPLTAPHVPEQETAEPAP